MASSTTGVAGRSLRPAVFALLVMAALFTPASSSPAAGQTTQALAERTQFGVPATVRRFAPAFFFHLDEEHWPMTARTFVQDSTLKFHYQGSCRDVEISSDPRARRLSGRSLFGPYEAHPTKLGFCEPQGELVYSNQLTVPGLDHVDRPPQLPKGNGFVLDLANDSRGGTMPSSAGSVYFEYEPGEYVSYWLLYGFSDGQGPVLADHEADWEHVTVRLDIDEEGKEQADSIAYFYHGDECVFDFRGPARGGDCMDITDMVLVAGTFGAGNSGTHPRVFVAEGSHASYWNRNCPQWFDTCSAAGLLWKSWKTATFVDIRNAHWYEYGGKWGRSRRGHKIQAPGPWRSSLPDDWYDDVNLDD